MADEFKIYLGRHTAIAQVVYQSDQVSRYKIVMGNKHFVLEQHHLKKSAKWKIKEATEDVDIKKLLEYLTNITSQIEKYIEPGSEFVHSGKSW